MVVSRMAPALEDIVLEPGTIVVDIPAAGYNSVGVVAKVFEGHTKFSVGDTVAFRYSTSQVTIGEIHINSELASLRKIIYPRHVMAVISRGDK